MARRSLFSNVIVAMLLAAGVQSVLFVVLALAYKPLRSALESFPMGKGQLRVHRNGQVLLADSRGDYRTVSGEPLDSKEFMRRFSGERLEWLSPIWLAGPLPDYRRQMRLNWSSRLHELPGDPRVSWFVVHSEKTDGLAYFVGYDEAANVVGYLGRRGFRPSLPPQDEWFAMSGEPRTHLVAQSSGGRTHAGLPVSATTAEALPGLVMMVADDELWVVFLISRVVRVLYDAAPTVSVALSTETDRAAKLLVRTTSEIVAIDFEGRPRASWKLLPELKNTPFQWYEFADGSALAQVQRDSNSSIFIDLTWFNRDGTITRSEKIEAYREHNFGPPVTYLAMAAMMPAPILMTPSVCVGASSVAIIQGQQPDFATALGHTLADAWPALLTLYLMSAFLAWLAYRRQVRYALPGAGLWGLFVFLFGLPGWLAYRWHRRWPVVQECGACHQPAPRDREACASCGQLFAPPPLVGTEIFA